MLLYGPRDRMETGFPSRFLSMDLTQATRGRAHPTPTKPTRS